MNDKERSEFTSLYLTAYDLGMMARRTNRTTDNQLETFSGAASAWFAGWHYWDQASISERTEVLRGIKARK